MFVEILESLFPLEKSQDPGSYWENVSILAIIGEFEFLYRFTIAFGRRWELWLAGGLVGRGGTNLEGIIESPEW